jgi:NAD-dependent DNA ligase
MDTIDENNLSGKVIVFTGKMEIMTRAEAKSICESIGMHVGDSITNSTNFLVTGEKTSSN